MPKLVKFCSVIVVMRRYLKKHFMHDGHTVRWMDRETDRQWWLHVSSSFLPFKDH